MPPSLSKLTNFCRKFLIKSVIPLAIYVCYVEDLDLLTKKCLKTDPVEMILHSTSIKVPF